MLFASELSFYPGSKVEAYRLCRCHFIVPYTEFIIRTLASQNVYHLQKEEHVKAVVTKYLVTDLDQDMKEIVSKQTKQHLKMTIKSKKQVYF